MAYLKLVLLLAAFAQQFAVIKTIFGGFGIVIGPPHVHNQNSNRCPNGWTYNSKVDRCWWYSGQESDWHGAQRICKSHGATLPMTKTNQMHHEFNAWRKQKIVFTAWVWIGLNDIKTAKQFFWDDGKRLNGNTHWRIGEPNNSWNNERCVYMEGIIGNWNDIKCDRPGIYVACEKPGAIMCAANPCKNGGTCRDSGKGYVCTCRSGYSGKNCGAGWMTVYDQAFTFECPFGEYLQTIDSIHDNGKEDRVFNFGCIPLFKFNSGAEMGGCEWTDYVNDWDGPIQFQCSNDNIIAGISSYHDNGKEDRKYKFQCCKPGNLVAHSCAFTPYVNSYDSHLNYRVPDHKVIRGVYSIHDNGKEDRIFRFDVCQLDALQGAEDLVG